jgi:hypothetical protein
MPPVRRLTESEAGYVAGIVDGEGTITLTRTHRGENRRPVISISSTEQPLLLYVRSVIGAGRITCKKCERAHHAPAFAYTISSRQALSVLRQISGLLRTYKAKRAGLLMNEYLLVTPRNGRYDARLRSAKEDFERRFFAITARASGYAPRRPGSR